MGEAPRAPGPRHSKQEGLASRPPKPAQGQGFCVSSARRARRPWRLTRDRSQTVGPGAPRPAPPSSQQPPSSQFPVAGPGHPHCPPLPCPGAQPRVPGLLQLEARKRDVFVFI